MSPEQMRGEPVDKRTDIWAFGCVLYEMVTGRPAFARQTISDTIAAILEREPEWDVVRTAAPAPVRTLLKQCLAKDARRRLRDIADARIQIEEILAEPPAARRASMCRAGDPSHCGGVSRLACSRLRLVSQHMSSPREAHPLPPPCS